MTPGCDSREDNNLSSDAEVPTLPAKTLPLSRSRSVKRDIVGTHPIFVFYSLGDVRDGFARDCLLRHPVRLMLALRDRSGAAPEFFLWMPGDFDGRGRGAEKTRHVWSEVAPVCVGGNCKFPIRGNRKPHTLVVGGLCPAFHDVGESNSEGAGGKCTDGRRGCC